MEGYKVVRPHKQRLLPPNDAFSLIKGQSVVLMLDALNDFTSVNLRDFYQKLTEYAQNNKAVIAATCRVGAELEAVKDDLGQFYEEIPLKLGLLPMTREEKASLATAPGARSGTPLHSITSPPQVPSFCEVKSIRQSHLQRPCKDGSKAFLPSSRTSCEH
jgi:hypothetical protein